MKEMFQGLTLPQVLFIAVLAAAFIAGKKFIPDTNIQDIVEFLFVGVGMAASRRSAAAVAVKKAVAEKGTESDQ